MKTYETIEAEANVTLLGVDFKAIAVAEVDDNEYLYPETVELICLKDANGDTYGHFPAIVANYSELDDRAQSAIEQALGAELRDYLNSGDTDRYKDDL